MVTGVEVVVEAEVRDTVPQIKTELEMACEYFGVTPSQFARQSIVEALMRCGVRPAPGLLYQQAQAAQAAKNVNGE
jgi:hypothetical protein